SSLRALILSSHCASPSFFARYRAHSDLPPFPTRRSSDLSDRVMEAATELSALLKKTRLQLAPEQQATIDGVAQRLSNYREGIDRSEEHTSELQSHLNLVCRLLLEKKKEKYRRNALH